MNRECDDLESAVNALSKVGRLFYDRDWVLGTGGNFSAVLDCSPLRLAMTASGLHKGELEQKDFLVVDSNGGLIEGSGKPSAEAALHIAIVHKSGAGAVLHTHSHWSTILSDLYAGEGGLAIEGFEMLKGLSGITTHEHREWVPIFENTQDYQPLVRTIENLPGMDGRIHGFLLRRHGLYTWGKNIFEARRHVEIFEFLFEVLGRQLLLRER